MQIKLETALDHASQSVGAFLGFTDVEQQEWINSIIQNFTEYLLNWLPQSLYQATINLVLILLVPFYIILILYYRSILVEALHKFIKQWSFDELKKILDDSIHTYFNFIKGMALVELGHKDQAIEEFSRAKNSANTRISASQWLEYLSTQNLTN